MKYKPVILLLTVLCAFFLLFHMLFFLDNKYNTPVPATQDGQLQLSDTLFLSGDPVFLIDDWMLYDGCLTPDELSSQKGITTYIGEYSNFQRADHDKKPLGEGTYRLQLRYEGTPAELALDLPELFTDYRLWWNGELLQEGQGTAHAVVTLQTGINELVVNTAAKYGYYAGMYFPGSLGSEAALLHVERIKTLCYSAAFLIPLTLALFSLFLWQQTGDRLRRRFGFMCISYALYISYYFVQLLGLPFAQYWYLIEDCSFYAMLYFAVRITLESAETKNGRMSTALSVLALAFPIIEVMLYFATPYLSWAVFIHGRIQDIYRLFIFSTLIAGGAAISRSANREQSFLLAGNAALGAGIAIQLIKTNHFEPVYGLWQMEWCGLALVLLFGGMLIVQNKRILLENRAYADRLEAMVDERTHQLSCVLEERRQFFSDMAHDLKAPLAAAKTFTQMIRLHSIGVDDELLYYIDQIEQKQVLMSKRVASLSELNAVDKISGPKARFSVGEFLDQAGHLYSPEAAVNEVHLHVVPCPELYIEMQREKLLIAFENIIYNAINATPENGHITLSAKKIGKEVQFNISDTGCGIAADELPLIFKRFYVGDRNQGVGSGLGLYIVKTIIEEAGGSVSAQSYPGSGTTISLRLPVSDK